MKYYLRTCKPMVGQLLMFEIALDKIYGILAVNFL